MISMTANRLYDLCEQTDRMDIYHTVLDLNHIPDRVPDPRDIDEQQEAWQQVTTPMYVDAPSGTILTDTYLTIPDDTITDEDGNTLPHFNYQLENTVEHDPQLDVPDHLYRQINPRNFTPTSMKGVHA